jgi:hypothetical protein
VSAPAMPAEQLAVVLHGTAAGICADAAAVQLICSHGHFLRQPAFRRIITAGSSFYSGEPVAVIRWRAAIHALEHGYLPSTPSEQAVLRIAASLGDEAIPVHLRALLGGLDRRSIALVTGAITTANGS